MPFCLHLNMLIFDLFFFSEFKMISFPLFCLFFFTRISAENLCLTWLFLSTEASPVVGRAPSHWAELGVWCPLFTPKLLHLEAPPKAGKCSEMHDSHTLTEQPEKCTERERILTWSSRGQRGLFGRVGFVPVVLEVLQTQRIKEPAPALEQLLAQQNTVQCFVLLVHFGINKRPSEIKTKEGEKGGD